MLSSNVWKFLSGFHVVVVVVVVALFEPHTVIALPRTVHKHSTLKDIGCFVMPAPSHGSCSLSLRVSVMLLSSFMCAPPQKKTYNNTKMEKPTVISLVCLTKTQIWALLAGSKEQQCQIHFNTTPKQKSCKPGAARSSSSHICKPVIYHAFGTLGLSQAQCFADVPARSLYLSAI